MSAEKYYKVPEWQLKEFIRANHELTWHHMREEYGEEAASHSSYCRDMDDDEVTKALWEFEEVEESVE